MWFVKFLDLISRFLPMNPLLKVENVVQTLDPQKIYVENVRSLLGVPYFLAVKICETAVRKGLFDRRIEVLSPDRSSILSVASKEQLPDKVRCWVRHDGDFEEIEVPVNTLELITFYKLHEESAA